MTTACLKHVVLFDQEQRSTATFTVPVAGTAALFCPASFGNSLLKDFHVSATDRENRLHRHVKDRDVIRTVRRHEGPACLDHRRGRNIVPNLAAVEGVKDREVAERLEGHLVLFFLTLSITV